MKDNGDFTSYNDIDYIAAIYTAEYRPLVEAAEAMICGGCDVRVGWPKGGCTVCDPLRAALRLVVGVEGERA